MAKSRKSTNPQVQEISRAARAAARQRDLDGGFRDGVRQRSNTLNPNRRAQSSRNACRKGNW